MYLGMRRFILTSVAYVTWILYVASFRNESDGLHVFHRGTLTTYIVSMWATSLKALASFQSLDEARGATYDVYSAGMLIPSCHK